MPAKRPTPKPRIALRSGFGEIGAVGTVAGTSTRKLPVAVDLEDLQVLKALREDEVVGGLLCAPV